MIEGQDKDKPVLPRLSRFRRLYTVGLIFLLLTITIGGNAWYTQRVDARRAAAERDARARVTAAEREADRRWCAIVTLFDDAYQEQPPPTELGRQIARAMHDLRLSLDC